MENQISKPQKISKIKTAYKACKNAVKWYWNQPLPEKAMLATGTISVLSAVHSIKTIANIVPGTPSATVSINEAGLGLSYAIAYLGVTCVIKGIADIIRKTKEDGLSGPTALGVGTVTMGLGYMGLAALGHQVGSPEFSAMAWTAGVIGVFGPIGAWIQNYESKKEAVKVKID